MPTGFVSGLADSCAVPYLLVFFEKLTVSSGRLGSGFFIVDSEDYYCFGSMGEFIIGLSSGAESGLCDS